MLHNCGHIKKQPMEKEKFNFRVSCLSNEIELLEVRYFNVFEEAIAFFLQLQKNYPNCFEVELTTVTH
jgi:hypothetical protein